MAMYTWFSRSNPWNKAYTHKFPAFDWDMNPDRHYLLSKLGKSNGARSGESFLQLVDKEKRFIFCCSETGAKMIHDSTVLVCDGTFKGKFSFSVKL